MARDNRPMQVIHCGGDDAHPDAPNFGLAYAETEDKFRNRMLREYVMRPGTRRFVLNPFGEHNGTDMKTVPNQPFAPPLAQDVMPWVLKAHYDAMEMARKVQPGNTYGMHIGLAVGDRWHQAYTHLMNESDKALVQESIRIWDKIGFNAPFAIDASSWKGNAQFPDGNQGIAEKIAQWIAPTAEIMWEAVPLDATNHPDAALLVKHPAWILYHNNDWVLNLATNDMTAPATYNGKECKECVIVYMSNSPPTEAHRAHMELARQRNFVLGGQQSFDAMIFEVMKKYP